MPRILRSLATFALALSCGCAGVSREAAQRPLESALDAMPIERPLEEVWPAVRHLLAERGYPLAGKDAEAEGQGGIGLLAILSRAKETTATGSDGRLLETGWDGRQVRYIAEAIAAPHAGFRVRLIRVKEDATEHGHDGQRQRDADLELELVRRVDPARAAAILERVEGGAALVRPPSPP